MVTTLPSVKQELRVQEFTITRHGTDDAGEYRAHMADGAFCGRLTWEKSGSARAAISTFVPPHFREHGIAARLVELMVADAREFGFSIAPVCSYVAHAFREHPEWADLQA